MQTHISLFIIDYSTTGINVKRKKQTPEEGRRKSTQRSRENAKFHITGKAWVRWSYEGDWRKSRVINEY